MRPLTWCILTCMHTRARTPPPESSILELMLLVLCHPLHLQTEPELIEETNVDRLMGQGGFLYGRGLKGHSETSTLSSQPSIDEVRQQMHLLLEEAFSLASGGQSTSGRQCHPHHHPPPDQYSPTRPPLPYTDVVTSAPGTMSCGRGGLQWVPSYGTDVYQCSLPKPVSHMTSCGATACL